MPPLQSNATLTKVSVPGAKDWDEPAGAENQKWAPEGGERVYFRQRVERHVDNGAVNVLQIRELILGGDSTAIEHIDTDDVLTFNLDGQDAQAGKASIITPTALAGMAPELATATIVLQPA